MADLEGVRRRLLVIGRCLIFGAWILLHEIVGARNVRVQNGEGASRTIPRLGKADKEPSLTFFQDWRVSGVVSDQGQHKALKRPACLVPERH